MTNNIRYIIEDLDVNSVFLGQSGKACVSFLLSKMIDDQYDEDYDGDYIDIELDLDVTYDENYNGRKNYYVEDFHITNLQEVKQLYKQNYHEEMPEAVLNLLMDKISNYYDNYDFNQTVLQYRKDIEEERLLSSAGL